MVQPIELRLHPLVRSAPPRRGPVPLPWQPEVDPERVVDVDRLAFAHRGFKAGALELPHLVLGKPLQRLDGLAIANHPIGRDHAFDDEAPLHVALQRVGRVTKKSAREESDSRAR